MIRVLFVYGTRPEAIKMAPVIAASKSAEGVDPVIAVTGQHRQMLDQVNGIFGITPQFDLDIIQPRQSLEEITCRTLEGLGPILGEVLPDCVFVQGDTTTCMAAALAAFYHQIPVVHLEAGLRTSTRHNPFPEEMNRRLTTKLSSLHLAPTPRARQNLIDEGEQAERICVTGNTVIDALQQAVSSREASRTARELGLSGRRLVLVTAHRRESWGEPMAESGRAIASLARKYPDVAFVLPIHRNPAVREVLLPLVEPLENVYVKEPLPYAEFALLLAESTIVLTDSGGIQEEAPSLAKPVLVMRETTERPEAVEAGAVRLVGTDREMIVAEVSRLLDDGEEYAVMANAVNPYGDGKAADRCIKAVQHFFGLCQMPEGFQPPLAPTSRRAN